MPNWDYLPRMPFGKHKGSPLDELPDDYLAWLLTRTLREPLASNLRAEARRREFEEEETHRAYRDHQRQQQYDGRQYSTAHRNGRPALEDVDDLIASGLKTLAKRFHPDVAGGDLARMQAINHAADWLRGRVRELLS